LLQPPDARQQTHFSEVAIYSYKFHSKTVLCRLRSTHLGKWM